jgi:hypothetical protein
MRGRTETAKFREPPNALSFANQSAVCAGVPLAGRWLELVDSTLQVSTRLTFSTEQIRRSGQPMQFQVGESYFQIKGGRKHNGIVFRRWNPRPFIVAENKIEDVQ